VNWFGKGIGTGLLKHALERCVQGATLIGGRALIVNAVDDEAAVFWQRHGFIESKDDPMVLSRSILDIAASLEACRLPEVRRQSRAVSAPHRP
jgi:hypothetical protein